MTKAGIIRAEGEVVSSAGSSDRVVIQQFNSGAGYYEPKTIEVSDLMASDSGVTTLVAGEATVANTEVTANSRIFLTIQSLGTVSAPQAIGVTDRSAGASFTITSADNTDTSTVAWHIIEPAA